MLAWIGLVVVLVIALAGVLAVVQLALMGARALIGRPFVDVEPCTAVAPFVVLDVSVDEHSVRLALWQPLVDGGSVVLGEGDEPLGHFIDHLRMVRSLRGALDAGLRVAEDRPLLLYANTIAELAVVDGHYQMLTGASFIAEAEAAGAVVIDGQSLAAGAQHLAEPGAGRWGTAAVLRLSELFDIQQSNGTTLLDVSHISRGMSVRNAAGRAAAALFREQSRQRSPVIRPPLSRS